MPNAELNARSRQQLGKASRAAIEQIIYSKVRRSTRKGLWIPRANRYRSDTLDKIRKDCKANPSQLQPSHLADYIAASSPTHAIDGWAMLGRAVAALIRGDRASCIHLAYYAELRAAMSLLASEGIGVFASKHFIVDENRQASLLNAVNPNSTHAVVWPFLDQWAKTKKSMDLLDITFQLHGTNMTQWLRAAQLAGSSHQIARTWFKLWGLDLKQLGDDHEARNEASYRPTEFNIVDPVSANEVSQFVMELWKLFEPSGTNVFMNIDLELLRLALEASFKGRTTKVPADDPAGFTVAINRALAAAPLEKSQVPPLRDYLLRKTHPRDSLLMQEAQKTDDTDNPRYHLQILARAVLLLRFSTGAARHLLGHANIRAPDLQFWFERYGSHHALWEAATPPDNPLELWSDIKDCLDGTSVFIAKSHPAGFSLHGWQQAQPQDIAAFSSCELIGIWGLAS